MWRVDTSEGFVWARKTNTACHDGTAKEEIVQIGCIFVNASTASAQLILATPTAVHNLRTVTKNNNASSSLNKANASFRSQSYQTNFRRNIFRQASCEIWLRKI